MQDQTLSVSKDMDITFFSACDVSQTEEEFAELLPHVPIPTGLRIRVPPPFKLTVHFGSRSVAQATIRGDVLRSVAFVLDLCGFVLAENLGVGGEHGTVPGTVLVKGCNRVPFVLNFDKAVVLCPPLSANIEPL